MDDARKDIHNSDVPVLCRSCEARHKGMCSVLAPEQLQAMSRFARRARHEAGAELAGDRTEITTYANVMKGVVKLTKTLENGRQQVVGLQFAPDFLGRLFARENPVTAEAASDVELCVVPKKFFESLVENHPALKHRLMKQALRELDEARAWMLTLGRKTAQEKLASFLHLIATHSDPTRERPAGRAEFHLPLGRADIADFLGLTVETVSRQFTRLRKMEVITVRDDRWITVPDMARLESLCG